MAKRSYRVGIPPEELKPIPEDVTVEPQMKVVEVSDEKIEKKLKKPTDPPIYKVRVTHPSLRRRDEPSQDGEVIGFITDQGIYDIYAEVAGWGWLEDGSWIMLQYTSKVD